MPIEVEMKFRVDDKEALLQSMAACGWKKQKEQHEEDTYFASPTRNFAETDEALRVRVIQGETNILTYKGPKQGSVGKIRTELESEIGDAVTFQRILHQLGFTIVATVKKQRTFYASTEDHRLTLSLDEVDSLGTFVELEQVTQEEGNEIVPNSVLSLACRLLNQQNAVKDAMNNIKTWAKRLGLSNEERRSYLQLLLECPSS